jgi:uncharacterized Tic20 family protein
LKNVLGMLKGEDKYETLENYSIFFIFIGAVMLALGIGLNAISTKGISAILAMFGALVSFISTIAFIVIWLVKDIFGE